MHQFGRLTDQDRQQQRDRNREQHTEAHARLTDHDRQQQRDRNREQHAKARARLTYPNRHQQLDHDREHHAEARARLTDRERQQERDRNREHHAQVRGQQALHIAACVPLLEFDEASVQVLDIGGRTAECQQCRATIWPDEAFRGHANLCCVKGRSYNCEAIFPILPPQPLRDLLTFELAPGARLPPATVSFRKHIRKYNSSLQMASSGINIQSPADGVSMIAIRGVVHHLLGPLAPPQGRPHQFAQLYIIDNEDAQVVARFATLGQGNVDLDRRTLQELQQMLLGSNLYVQRFVQAMDLPP